MSTGEMQYLAPPLLNREAVDRDVRDRASGRTRGFLKNAASGLLLSGVLAALGQWHVAGANLAVNAGILAIRLWVDRFENGFLKLLDGPGGRLVASAAISNMGPGAAAIDRGYRWAVYDSPAAEPRMMSEADYRAFRVTVPHLVEIVAHTFPKTFEDNGDRDHITISRFTSGVPDSSSTGQPAIETFDRDGKTRGNRWFMMGRETTMGEVMKGLLEESPADDAEASGPTP